MASGVLLAVGPDQCFKKAVLGKQWVLGMALLAHCKGLAEERSDKVNVLKCSLEGGPTRGWQEPLPGQDGRPNFGPEPTKNVLQHDSGEKLSCLLRM
jgi:hypothetical protein